MKLFFALGLPIFALSIIACNPSTSLTNANNIPYEELEGVTLKDTLSYPLALAIASEHEFDSLLQVLPADTQLSLHPIKYKKECVALIAFPPTDIDQQIYIDLLEQKSDTLKLYYSLISNKERVAEPYQPLKVVRLRNKHKVLLLLRK